MKRVIRASLELEWMETNSEISASESFSRVAAHIEEHFDRLDDENTGSAILAASFSTSEENE